MSFIEEESIPFKESEISKLINDLTNIFALVYGWQSKGKLRRKQ